MWFCIVDTMILRIDGNKFPSSGYWILYQHHLGLLHVWFCLGRTQMTRSHDSTGILRNLWCLCCRAMMTLLRNKVTKQSNWWTANFILCSDWKTSGENNLKYFTFSKSLSTPTLLVPQYIHHVENMKKISTQSKYLVARKECKFILFLYQKLTTKSINHMKMSSATRKEYMTLAKLGINTKTKCQHIIKLN